MGPFTYSASVLDFGIFLYLERAKNDWKGMFDKTLVLHTFYAFAMIIIEEYIIFTLYLNINTLVCLYHQYRARPAFTSAQSDHTLYFWLTNFKFRSLYVLKIIMDSAENGR